MNVFDLLDRPARRFPHHGAIYLGAERCLTFAELHERALRLAGGLGRGKPGGRVALVSENRPEYIEILFAIWAAGQTAVPINAKLHPREVAAILEDAGASTLLVSPDLAGEIAAAIPEAMHAAVTTIEIGSSGYAQLLSTPAVVPVDTPPDALAWLFYTSGTTGRSKGAMLSHRNLMAMTLSYLADISSPHETTSLIHGAPMSHGSGLYILPFIGRGARQVVPASAGFDPGEFLDLCEQHPGCGAFLAPTMVHRVRLEAERRGRRPANLSTIVYGGGPMYVEELKKAMADLGPVFAQIYGQGEAPMTITGLRRQDHDGADDAVLGSVGWARSGVEVAVVSADGKPVPLGEPGEIVCRGDIVCLGYWNNPDATAQTIRNGWLYTGDIGFLDERGRLTLRDRSKDVVISGGSNIYPREVEEVLLEHADVREVSVIGQSDPEWGEVVVAFVVRGEGNVTEAALDAHCLARIARFKRPKRYVFVDALPKNSYGKVLKRQLRETLR